MLSGITSAAPIETCNVIQAIADDKNLLFIELMMCETWITFTAFTETGIGYLAFEDDNTIITLVTCILVSLQVNFLVCLIISKIPRIFLSHVYTWLVCREVVFLF